MSFISLLNTVRQLITTPQEKDGVYLMDWMEESDTYDMTPEEIAQEWDEMETDSNAYNTELSRSAPCLGWLLSASQPITKASQVKLAGRD